jgi:DNA-directed RNA polymerase specialized sigma24 family protein
MRFADQLSYEEIAEALDISMGTVKSRINRARTELRKLMEPYL